MSLDAVINTEFIGYDSLNSKGRVTGIFSINGEKLDKISANEEVYVLLDQSPFYAESGVKLGIKGFCAKMKGNSKC